MKGENGGTLKKVLDKVIHFLWINHPRPGFKNWLRHRFREFLRILPTKKYHFSYALPDSTAFVSTCGKTIKYGPEWFALWKRGKVK